jgi:hypothetical protein
MDSDGTYVVAKPRSIKTRNAAQENLLLLLADTE